MEAVLGSRCVGIFTERIKEAPALKRLHHVACAYPWIHATHLRVYNAHHQHIELNADPIQMKSLALYLKWEKLPQSCVLIEHFLDAYLFQLFIFCQYAQWGLKQVISLLPLNVSGRYDVKDLDYSLISVVSIFPIFFNFHLLFLNAVLFESCCDLPLDYLFNLSNFLLLRQTPLYQNRFYFWTVGSDVGVDMGQIANCSKVSILHGLFE